MMTFLALPRWRQLCAAWPGRGPVRDTTSARPTRVYPEHYAAMERRRAVLATISLGWGSCFLTPRTFFWDDLAGAKAY
jgi:hypothetical protein